MLLETFACSSCGLRRNIARVGTRVLDKMYEAIIAKITASANGIKRNFGTPFRKNIGRNTMQMHIVDTSAGVAICAAPSRMPS